MRTLFILTTLAACGHPGAPGSCDVDLLCSDGPVEVGTSRDILQMKCTFENEDAYEGTCSCLENNVEFASCDAEAVCRTVDTSVGTPNEQFQTFTDELNRCCGTNWTAAVYEDVEAGGCALNSYGYSPGQR